MQRDADWNWRNNCHSNQLEGMVRLVSHERNFISTLHAMSLGRDVT